MEISMLDLVNEFLVEKGRPSVGYTDTLYSSGLLDSMEMCELMLFLQNNGKWVDPTLNGSQLDLSQMDSAELLEKIVRK
jgi:hypothetical protein